MAAYKPSKGDLETMRRWHYRWEAKSGSWIRFAPGQEPDAFAPLTGQEKVELAEDLMALARLERERAARKERAQ